MDDREQAPGAVVAQRPPGRKLLCLVGQGAAAALLMTAVAAVVWAVARSDEALRRAVTAGSCDAVPAAEVQYASWARLPLWPIVVGRLQKAARRHAQHLPDQLPELPPGAEPVLDARIWVEGEPDAISPAWAEVPALAAGTRFTVTVNSSHAGRLRIHAIAPGGLASGPALLDTRIEPGMELATPALRLAGPRGLERLCVALLDAQGRVRAVRDLPLWHL